MLDRVVKTISRYNMLPAGSRVIVAVSGGADSVCLLYVLKELFPDSLAGIAHFNHKWRAEASDEDERFVAGIASQLGLPFFRAEAAPGAPQGNLEQQSRRARYAFFSGLGTRVALGHTRDDQAETVLFRFLRGSGLAGLAGIPPIAHGIIRPLIEVSRRDVEDFLRTRGIPWREDATNLDTRFARNRIRHELLPQLARDWNPQIADGLVKLADLAYEEEKYWVAMIGRLADRQFFRRNAGLEVRAKTLFTLPRPVARRLIRHAIALAKGDLRQIDFDHIESVLNIRRNIRLPGLNVTRSFDWVRFEPDGSSGVVGSQTITRSGVYPSPDGLTEICVDIAQSGAPEPCATLNVEVSPLELRGWRPGDHYRPQGQSRDQNIQEMFQKARIPSWRRASWPILTSGDKILWARQFGVAEEFAEHGKDGRGTVLRVRERWLAEPYSEK